MHLLQFLGGLCNMYHRQKYVLWAKSCSQTSLEALNWHNGKRTCFLWDLQISFEIRTKVGTKNIYHLEGTYSLQKKIKTCKVATYSLELITSSRYKKPSTQAFFFWHTLPQVKTVFDNDQMTLIFFAEISPSWFIFIKRERAVCSTCTWNK